MAPLPLWQLAQLVAAVNLLWSGLAADQLAVDLWQVSQLPVTEAWTAVAGLLVRPKFELKWQVAHWFETATLLWKRPGLQLA